MLPNVMSYAIAFGFFKLVSEEREHTAAHVVVVALVIMICKRIIVRFATTSEIFILRVCLWTIVVLHAGELCHVLPAACDPL